MALTLVLMSRSERIEFKKKIIYPPRTENKPKNMPFPKIWINFQL